VDTFRIALSEPVHFTHAQPANDSERLVFRNIRSHLVTVDCQGEPRPGIIRSWTADAPGSLTFALEDPGTAVTFDMTFAQALASRLAPPRGPKISGIDSAIALNERQLRLFITASPDTLLRVLADPALAVPDGFPFQDVQGTRMLNMPGFSGQPELQFRMPPLGDLRDALDRWADLLVTRDPALLEYAARRHEFTVHSLPWSRTYVLVQPELAPPLTAVSSEVERQSLARDAVPGEARGAEPPFWWTESSCPTGNPSASPTSDRVVYNREDDVARALAERLVALGSRGNRLRAAGLEESVLAAALRAGSERAYVMSLPRHPVQPCPELRDFPTSARILPLIDSRAHAIVRQGAPPLTADWDGTVGIVRP
jgi:hypothetical protein